MIKLKHLNYVATWTKDKKNTWSGTSYSLKTALNNLYDVEDIDVTLNFFQKAIVRISEISFGRNKGTKPKVCNKYNSKFLKSNMNKLIKDDSKSLEIGCIGKLKGEYYTYQDLCVEAIIDLKNSDNEAYQFSTYQNICVKDLKRRAHEQMKVYKDATAIFTMGKWLADFMVNNMGLSKEKVFHVGGGTNIDYNLVDFTQKKGNKFLFVGRDFVRKGGDLICNAFDLLQKEYLTDIYLYVAGPNTIPDECRINSHIIFLGDLEYNSLVKYFNICDVFCMPSRYEAYGLVFVEALIFGLPCLGRNKFEMKHFIEDNVNGLLINDYDDIKCVAEKMLYLLNNTQIKDYVRSKNEEYIANYSWDSVAKRIKEVIEHEN